METAAQFMVPGIIFLLTLASGVWLSRSGKPYHTIIFNSHKLIALATVIFTTVQIARQLRTTEIQVTVILLVVLIGLCVLALFVTGALMSLEKPMHHLYLTIHRVSPIFGVISLAMTIYILAGGES